MREPCGQYSEGWGRLKPGISETARTVCAQSCCTRLRTVEIHRWRIRNPYNGNALRNRSVRQVGRGPMKLRSRIAAATALAICASTANAWWNGGHETVAYIAYKRLTPATRQRVDS